MATAVSQAATGNPYIDGVLSGVKWSGTVTYSFPDSPSDYPGMGYGSGEPFNDFKQVSARNRPPFTRSCSMIGNFTNLTISFAGTDGADIRLAHSDDANPTAYAYYPSNAANGMAATSGSATITTTPTRSSAATSTSPTSMRSATPSASSMARRPAVRWTSPFRLITTRSNIR